jgi:hypothetical protein
VSEPPAREHCLSRVRASRPSFRPRPVGTRGGADGHPADPAMTQQRSVRSTGVGPVRAQRLLGRPHGDAPGSRGVHRDASRSRQRRRPRPAAPRVPRPRCRRGCCGGDVSTPSAGPRPKYSGRSARRSRPDNGTRCPRSPAGDHGAGVPCVLRWQQGLDPSPRLIREHRSTTHFRTASARRRQPSDRCRRCLRTRAPTTSASTAAVRTTAVVRPSSRAAVA